MLLGTLGCLLTVSLGAAPATPSYVGVEQTIAKVRSDWEKGGANVDPNAPGWNIYFDAIRSELQTYSTAPNEGDRLRSLGRLYQMWAGLTRFNWGPSNEVRDSLAAWLTPRVTLAWAYKSISDSLQGLPPADQATQENRDRWLKFVSDDLGTALRNYESAASVPMRLQALKDLNASLASLSARNAGAPWGPSLSLEQAVATLYDRQNLQATADVNTLTPIFSQNVVDSGPVFREGVWSYVTAGPKTGFGLLHSDDGIAFWNSQALSSVTPITNFEQQLQQDKRGRQADKLYAFAATSTDYGQQVATAILRPSGVQLLTNATHHVAASISSVPRPGKGFGRAIAALIGLNQNKITQKVYEGAIGQITQGVYRGSAAEAAERKAVKEQQENAKLTDVLIGNNTARVKNIEINDLVMRSRPQFVIVDGTLHWAGIGGQLGADMPKPASLMTVAPGMAADVHLGSVLSNLIEGLMQTEKVKSVQNVMIVTKNAPPGTAPKDAIETAENVDFATYAKRVQDARAANDPKVVAIRVKRPEKAPLFSADRNGFLVALVRDFQIEVPAPANAAKGGIAGPPAQIYRMIAPNAEFSISFTVAPAQAGQPMTLHGRIENFDPGPGSQVFAINDDEAKAAELTKLAASFIGVALNVQLKGKPIDVPMSNVKLQGFAIDSVSNLDPSGWMRVVLHPTGPIVPPGASEPELPNVNEAAAPVPAAASATATAPTVR
jgi:hypothetical protein